MSAKRIRQAEIFVRPEACVSRSPLHEAADPIPYIRHTFNRKPSQSSIGRFSPSLRLLISSMTREIKVVVLSVVEGGVRG